MTRGRLAAAAVALAVVAALVVAAVFVGRWAGGEGGSYAPRRTTVRTSLSPQRSLFGQVVTATVTVTVDPRQVDPSTVVVRPSFAPYSLRSEDDGHSKIGRARVETFTYRLQCVVVACVPTGGAGRARSAATAFQLRPVRVAARSRDGSAVRLTAGWPVLGVQSRLTADDIALAEPVFERSGMPSVTWRVRPDLLASFAVLLAVLCVLGAGVLAGSVALADGRPLRVLRIPANLSPVERALRLAEHAARRGETDESRKALERLAVELRRRGAEANAAEAERLAWSAGSPTRATVEELATSVRSNGTR